MAPAVANLFSQPLASAVPELALGLIITPSPYRQAIINLLIIAAAKNETVLVVDRGVSNDELRAGPLVWVGSDPVALEGYPISVAAMIPCDIGRSVEAAAATHRLEPRDALHLTSRCAAGVAALKQQGVPAFAEVDVLSEPAKFFPRILDHLGLSLNPAALESAVAGFEAETAAARSTAEVSQIWGFYERHLTPSGKAAHWPRQFFFSADAPGQPCPKFIDVTGRSRPLVHGPSIYLPPGRWLAKARFRVCADAAENPLLFQFGQSPDFEELIVEPSRAGLYEVSTQAIFRRPTCVDIRVSLVHAAFHGVLEFEGATLRWLDPGEGSA